MDRQYVGARYVPKFSDPIEWNKNNSYEALTIVTYLNSSYTSKKPVPVGIEITNTDYWVVTGNYNAQVEQYRQEAEEYKDEVNGYRQEVEEYKQDVEANNKFFDWIKGKTINVFGDSMSDTGVTPNAWPTQLNEKLGCNVLNNSVTGRTFSGNTGLASQIDSLPKSNDMNIVMLGVNDGWSESDNMGTFDTKDINTFIGACKKVFSAIASACPSAVNVYACNPKTMYDSGGYYRNNRLYYFIAYEIAKDYGFLFWDMYNALPGYAPDLEYSKELYATDGMHPNEQGQDLLTDIICRYIKNKRNDNFPPTTFVVTNTISDIVGGTDKYANAHYNTDHVFTVDVGCQTTPVSAISDYAIKVCSYPPFFRPVNNTVVSAVVSVPDKNSLDTAHFYHSTTISLAYYSQNNPTDAFRCMVRGSWYNK